MVEEGRGVFKKEAARAEELNTAMIMMYRKKDRMQKVLLINFFSKNESGYVDFYTSALNDGGISYDSLYFERYQLDNEPGENEIFFREYCPTGGNKIKKIKIMWRYMRFLRKLVKSGKYSYFIIFTTPPAIMIFDLLKKFRNKYILDIRDYTHEKNRVYYRIEKRIIRDSFKTALSSRGFLRFLPKSDKYFFTHNILKEYKMSRKSISGTKREAVHIGFVGSIRYFEENKAFIDQFRNNKAVILYYYGTTAAGCNLEEYCKNEGIENVKFMGRFSNQDKNHIYQNIDIINSVYGIQGLETLSAIPNRLYDAAIYGCPIIVSKGTYLAEIVDKYHLGIAVDVFKDNLQEQLDVFSKIYDRESFFKNCDLFLEDVKTDLEKQRAVLHEFASLVQGAS